MRVSWTDSNNNLIKKKAENPGMLPWENTTGMELIETTSILVTHNATFNAELSKNTAPGADVHEQLSKAIDPAPNIFLTEFNKHQTSPSAAVTQNAVCSQTQM